MATDAAGGSAAPEGAASRRGLRPLTVAASASLVGGVGNVTFSLHSGSQVALAFWRFLFGALLCAAFLALVRPSRPELRQVGRQRALVALAGASGAASVSLLIVSAAHVSTLTFTVLALVAPAVLAVAARALGLPSGSRRQGLLAAVAILAAAAATFAASPEFGSSGALGVALASAASLLSVVSSLAVSFAASIRHPAHVLMSVCLWGVLLTGLAAVLGAGFTTSRSTLLVALFVAAVPGGLAKVAVFWSYARTAPYLVSATSAVALLSAGLFGWLLLGQVPTAVEAALALTAAAAVFGMQMARDPA